MIVFGTRPEAIKLAPIIRELKRAKWADVTVCVTAQHREMLDQVLNSFQIVPDIDLNIMKAEQDLFSLSSDVLLKMRDVLVNNRPDLVIIQGDTTTVFITSLTAFYLNIKVAHIEAGLRTWNKRFPFPEEMNRTLTSFLADIHFAPTDQAKRNLLNEGIEEDRIFITGNTVIDALFMILDRFDKENERLKAITQQYEYIPINGKKIVLVTLHRRESIGEGFRNCCNTIKDIAQRNTDVVVIFPVHLNPKVRRPVYEILNGLSNVFLIEPLEYEQFIYFMKSSYIILTDSGGIQEEAPSLGKPVLVMRNETERTEAIEAGTAILVGTDRELIISETEKFLNNRSEYTRISKLRNPYGDGKASKKIVKILNSDLYHY